MDAYKSHEEISLAKEPQLDLMSDMIAEQEKDKLLLTGGEAGA